MKRIKYLAFLVLWILQPVFALEIDGIELGITSCEEALKKSYEKYFESCVKNSSGDLTNVKNSSGDLTNLPGSASLDACQAGGKKKLEETLQKYGQWKGTAEPCFPAYGLHDAFRDAFRLRGGFLDYRVLELQDCPLNRFFVDNHLGRVACHHGKVVYYHKTAVAKAGEVRKHLSKKYGAMEKKWKNVDPSTEKLVGSLQPTNSLYQAQGGKILVVQMESKNAGVASVYYVVEDFLKALGSDVLWFEKYQAELGKKVEAKKKDLKRSGLEEL